MPCAPGSRQKVRKASTKGSQSQAVLSVVPHRYRVILIVTVFLDESVRLIEDPDHSGEEERFVLLGYSFQARCLIVNHCYRESDSVVRLISARRATAQEEEVHWRLR